MDRDKCCIGFSTMDKCKFYSDRFNCLQLLLFFTRFCLNSACYFVASKRSENFIYPIRARGEFPQIPIPSLKGKKVFMFIVGEEMGESKG